MKCSDSLYEEGTILNKICFKLPIANAEMHMQKDLLPIY